MEISTVLAWVGGLTAVLALGFSLHRLAGMVGDARGRRAQAADALATADAQRRDGHYREAWDALDGAAQLAPGSQAVRTTREDLAMEWLREIRVRDGEQRFADIVRLVQPVLIRAEAVSRGTRRADLVAHLGWADFLLWRDGRRDLQPDDRYRRAIEIDSGSPFAHAMRAHWLMWRGHPPHEARTHFDAALAGADRGPARAWVRRLQYSAYRNRGDIDADIELFRVADELRREGNRPELDERLRFAGAYARRQGRVHAAVHEGHRLEPVVTADDDLETLAWLTDDIDLQGADAHLRDLSVALLHEAAGRTDRARAVLESLRAALPPSSALAPGLDTALRRLGRPATGEAPATG